MATKSKRRKPLVKRRASRVRVVRPQKTQGQIHAAWLAAERAFRDVERQFYPVPGQGEPKPVTEEGRRQMEQLRQQADVLREQYFAAMPKR